MSGRAAHSLLLCLICFANVVHRFAGSPVHSSMIWFASQMSVDCLLRCTVSFVDLHRSSWWSTVLRTDCPVERVLFGLFLPLNIIWIHLFGSNSFFFISGRHKCLPCSWFDLLRKCRSYVRRLTYSLVVIWFASQMSVLRTSWIWFASQMTCATSNPSGRVRAVRPNSPSFKLIESLFIVRTASCPPGSTALRADVVRPVYWPAARILLCDQSVVLRTRLCPVDSCLFGISLPHKSSGRYAPSFELTSFFLLYGRLSSLVSDLISLTSLRSSARWSTSSYWW